MKVMLVEDNKFIRDLVSQLLESLGHNILMATDKETACDIIQQQCRGIDLILTDNDLSAPDEGLEIIDFIQGIVGFFGINNIPIILMSGKDKSAAAENAGVEFLSKPFSLSELKSAIQRVVTKKEQHIHTYDNK